MGCGGLGAPPPAWRSPDGLLIASRRVAPCFAAKVFSFGGGPLGRRLGRALLRASSPRRHRRAPPCRTWPTARLTHASKHLRNFDRLALQMPPHPQGGARLAQLEPLLLEEASWRRSCRQPRSARPSVRSPPSGTACPRHPPPRRCQWRCCSAHDSPQHPVSTFLDGLGCWRPRSSRPRGQQPQASAQAASQGHDWPRQ